MREEHAQEGSDGRSQGHGQHVVAHPLALAAVRHERRYDGADGGGAHPVSEAVQQADGEQGGEPEPGQVEHREHHLADRAHDQQPLAPHLVHDAAADEARREGTDDEDARGQAGRGCGCVVGFHGVVGHHDHEAVVVHHEQEVHRRAQREVLRPEPRLRCSRHASAPPCRSVRRSGSRPGSPCPGSPLRVSWLPIPRRQARPPRLP